MVNGGDALPILLCVDLEPDDREPRVGVDPDTAWRATADCLQLIAAARARREEQTGESVLVNWFWRADPQIQRACGQADWAVRRFLGRIQADGNPGDGHGNHPHVWRWSEAGQRWFNDFDDAEWVARCLCSSHEVLTHALPMSPLSIRFGDRWTSAAVVRTLVALGYQFDLTPEPGERRMAAARYEPFSTGFLPEYRRTPIQPYFPSDDDPCVPARDGHRRSIQMIPVTTLRRWRLTRRFPFIHLAATTLNLAYAPTRVRAVTHAALNHRQRPIVAVMRSGDCAGVRRSHIEMNLRDLFGLDGIRFATPQTMTP